MSVQEVMKIITRIISDAYCVQIINVLVLFFALVFVSSGFLTMMFEFEKKNKKASDISGVIAVLSCVLIIIGLVSQHFLVEKLQHQQKVLAQEVITKKSETWMDWKQDEKGNYHFDNSNYEIPTANKDIVVKPRNVKQYDLSPTAGSVPIAEVTTKNISKRFTKEQKEKIKKVLPEHSLDSSAEVDE